jgi:hypothetical protein
MADLRALLAAREPLYALADHTVQTSGVRVEKIVDTVERLLHTSNSTPQTPNSKIQG